MDDPQGAQQPGLRPMGLELPTGTDAASVRKRIEAMEHLLERSFTIPGINYPIGLDSIVGLVPVIGDIVTAAMGSYLIWEARNLGLPKWKLARMVGNVGFDSLVGAVPLSLPSKPTGVLWSRCPAQRTTCCGAL